MATKAETHLTYFQYVKDLNLPVYICADLTQFTSSLRVFLESLGFHEVDESEVDQKAKNSRVLTISRASAMVARQIELMRPTDKYGQESLIPKPGYKVYRYRGVGMMIFSLATRDWELGCYENFGSGDNLTRYRVMVNRFLSWALASHGVVGFWGVPVDEGAVVLNQNQSHGEAIFVDIYNHRLLTVDGVREFSGGLQLMRLDGTLKGREVTMKPEELGCFLTQQCTYMDDRGLTVPVRQMIQSVSKTSLGVVYPKESFKPRTDLSL